MINSPLFTLVEFNILIASLGVVFLPRIIYAALCLAFVLINIALLYLLLNAEFLAADQVLVYVVAFNVLIVFAIMLVNVPLNQNESHLNTGNIMSGLLTILLLGILLTIIINTPFELNTFTNPNTAREVEAIGTALFTHFLIPFELLSILLLIALVGAINIARKDMTIK